MADEEIDEIRKIRHDISMRFEHDISRLVAHYQELKKIKAVRRIQVHGF